MGMTGGAGRIIRFIGMTKVKVMEMRVIIETDGITMIAETRATTISPAGTTRTGLDALVNAQISWPSSIGCCPSSVRSRFGPAVRSLDRTDEPSPAHWAALGATAAA